MAKRPLAPQLTANARTVLESRYLAPLQDGTRETPTQLFSRVAKAVASVEKRNRAGWESKFYELMSSLRFLPNSPTLMNAGKKGGQLSACFVLPIEDSLDGIFDSLKYAAKIHQSGGGTGFSFSNLRPEGSEVRTSRGIASGPVSFMKIFDVATETIKQGGTRRGANMAVLRVDHPDILKFIDSKQDLKSVTNFNISVGATRLFMNAVLADGEFALRDPRTHQETRRIRARELFKKIAESAWKCGDPGLVFLDRMNDFNPTPQVGQMESTNPCGEQPLLPFESCNLGSINLSLYFQRAIFDWKKFADDIRLSIRFLDNVIDLNVYPVQESRRITHKNRKIGLGVMGFADLLLDLNIPYDSKEARQWGEKLMSFLDRTSKEESARLAKERGAFPNWKGSLWQRLGYSSMRNATVSTVAPTGTISMIAGASSGIEPVFSGIFYRNVLSGQRLQEIHPKVSEILRRKGLETSALSEAKIAQELGPAWSPAHAVSIEGHILMQAVFQRHSDSAVSKTINLPHSASRGDIERAYLMAYESGCKGITVYRDRSRNAQVLDKSDIVCIDCD